MARQYPFTRTITTQTVTALVFDKETAEASNTTITLPEVISEPAKLDRIAAKLLNKGNIKFIEVVDTQVEEQLYGITLEDFLEKAVKLDPKTRKPIEVANDE